MSGLVSRNAFERPRPVRDEGRVEPVGTQDDAQHLGECGVVVDHENARFHGPIVSSRGCAGADPAARCCEMA